MTILLPQDDTAARDGAPDVMPRAARDYGAHLVSTIAPVKAAAELCAVDCSIHDAANAFDAFASGLTSETGDVESWTERFSAQAKGIRDHFIRRIPEGPGRDRFDEAFDLFAKAKAVEIRSLAARKRVQTNRSELERALAGYGDMIARAANPVSADFALRQGEIAIRNQVDAGVLTEEEGGEIKIRFRSEIAEKRAAQYIRDDPAEAAEELGKTKGGLFRDLPRERRRTLAAGSRRAADARYKESALDERLRAPREDTLRSLRAQAFLNTLKDRTDAGDTTLTMIAEGERAGFLKAEEAKRELENLHAVLERRRTDTARVAALMNDADILLDPGDPDDRRAADAHWTDVVVPLLDGLPPRRRLAMEDSLVIRSGIVPDPLQKSLRADLLAPDPAKQVEAATRLIAWQSRQPSIPVALEPRERILIDALGPYIGLPLDPARIVELANVDIEKGAVGRTSAPGERMPADTVIGSETTPPANET